MGTTASRPVMLAATQVFCWTLILSIATSRTAVAPRWHFVPPCHTGDPSLVYTADGVYHNFYQASGEVWGHATTRDWVTWEDSGPLNNTYQQGTGTLWTSLPLGAPTDPPGVYVRAYATTPATVGICLDFTSDPSLVSWTPSGACPLTPLMNPFEDGMVADPFIFFDNDIKEWVILANTCVGGTQYFDCEFPRITAYRSASLNGNFTTRSDYFVGPASTGIRPECPRSWQFPHKNGNVTLIQYSSTIMGKVVWYLGSTDKTSYTFTPFKNSNGLIDYSSIFYASHIFPAPETNGTWGGDYVVGVGDVHEDRSDDGSTPWFGILSVPRNTSIAADGVRISQVPARWISDLRTPVWQSTVFVAGGSSPISLPVAVSNTGASLWLDVRKTSEGCGARQQQVANALQPTNITELFSVWSVLVLANGPGRDRDEFTRVRVSSADGVGLDTSHAGSGHGTGAGTPAAQTSTALYVGVTILVDQNVVEVFAHTDIDGAAVVTGRAYTRDQASTHVFLAADDDVCLQVNAYAMLQK